jgi:glycosyltransferase involved in cell wall biosynthesis
MKISVVVCTYSMDRYDDFTEAVESVLAQTYEPVEVVLVVDGNSAVYDRVVDRFGDRDDVMTYCNEENQGISYSRTKGAELASGDVVAFIDDDAVADPDWIERLVEGYEEHDAIAVGGRMVGEWLVGRPSFLPAEFNWLVGITYPGFAADGEEVRNTFESNLSFRRNAFLDLGGFDPDLGPDAESYSHSEGAEIGTRLRQEYDRGVVYISNAVVAHKVFANRVRIRWLLARAFEQGRSKQRLERRDGGSNGEERAYLRQLLFIQAPRRLRSLVRSPSVGVAIQLCMLFVFTAAVGFGYLYGIVKWR